MHKLVPSSKLLNYQLPAGPLSFPGLLRGLPQPCCVGCWKRMGLGLEWPRPSRHRSHWHRSRVADPVISLRRPARHASCSGDGSHACIVRQVARVAVYSRLVGANVEGCAKVTRHVSCHRLFFGIWGLPAAQSNGHSKASE